jgi:hypothetical protein
MGTLWADEIRGHIRRENSLFSDQDFIFGDLLRGFIEMFAYLHLLSAALIGIWLLRRLLGRRLELPEQILGGVAFGWILAAWVAYFIGGLQKSLAYGSMVGLTALLCLVAAILWASVFRHIIVGWRSVLQPGPHLPLLLLLAFTGCFYGYSFATQSFPLKEDGLYTGGAMFADMPFHLSMITSFLYGDNFPPTYRIFPPDPLTYPFLPDFQAAVLMKLGLSINAALVTTGVPLALALTGLLYCLAKRLLAHWQAAILATFLFLFGGGFGFLYFLEDWRRRGQGLWQFLSHQPMNYAHEGNLAVYWDSVIVGQILPQRPSLYGMAIAFLVCILFAGVWRRWAEEQPQAPWDGWEALLAAGVMVGLLPRVHSFTFIALGLISVGIFLLRPRRVWILFWLAALLLALPQIIDVNQHIMARHFFYLQPGWLGNYQKSWPLFWLRNFGLPLLLIFPAWFAASRTWRAFYLPFALVFAFCFFVSVSPDPYNNTKLFYYWYALTTILIAGWLYNLATEHRQRFLTSLLVLVSTATGFVTFCHAGFHSWLMFSREEMAAAAFAREQTAPHAVILAAPTFTQPIVCMAGRATVLGFVPWLWSHGYTDAEIDPRLADIKAVYKGSPNTGQILERYGVSYIYFSPAERKEFDIKALPPDWRFPVVFHHGDITIFTAR